MSNEKKDYKRVAAGIVKDYDMAYFVVVDQVDEVKDENGNLVQKLRKPLYREQVFCINDPAYTDPKSGSAVRAKAVKLVPNKFNGVYQGIDCNRNAEDAERCVAIMLKRADDKGNPIIGPFATFDEAVRHGVELREDTLSQSVTKLAAKVEAKDEVLEALKARIAELETPKK